MTTFENLTMIVEKESRIRKEMEQNPGIKFAQPPVSMVSPSFLSRLDLWPKPHHLASLPDHPWHLSTVPGYS